MDVAARRTGRFPTPRIHPRIAAGIRLFPASSGSRPGVHQPTRVFVSLGGLVGFDHCPADHSFVVQPGRAAYVRPGLARGWDGERVR